MADVTLRPGFQPPTDLLVTGGKRSTDLYLYAGNGIGTDLILRGSNYIFASGGLRGDANIIELPDILVADGINFTSRIGDAVITETSDIILADGTSGAGPVAGLVTESYVGGGSYNDFFIRNPENVRSPTLAELRRIREEEEVVIL
jgi:hypothetical protein